MEPLFGGAVLLVLFPHLFFPPLVRLLGRIAPPRPRTGPGASGPVAVLCCAYNEEKVIAAKVANFLALDAPEARLYLGLDGCSDGTAAEARRAAAGSDRVVVLELPRGGKAATINAVMEQIAEPFVVMTDANSMFRPDAVRRLMAEMRDGVGVVCGRLVLVDPSGASGEGFHWRRETALKEAESAFGSVVGANGAIYLIRRHLFEPLPPGTVNDDFTVSMRIWGSGWDSVYAPGAVAEEEQVATDREEFRRHVRDGAGHYRAVALLWPLLNPLHGKRFFFYVGHRVLRWAAPFLMLLALAANGALASSSTPWRILFALHLAGYGAAAAVLLSGVKWRPLHAAAYFVALNGALLLGFLRLVSGRQAAAWAPTRR